MGEQTALVVWDKYGFQSIVCVVLFFCIRRVYLDARDLFAAEVRRLVDANVASATSTAQMAASMEEIKEDISRFRQVADRVDKLELRVDGLPEPPRRKVSATGAG